MKKRGLLVVLCLMLCITLIPVSAFADDGNSQYGVESINNPVMGSVFGVGDDYDWDDGDDDDWDDEDDDDWDDEDDDDWDDEDDDEDEELTPEEEFLDKYDLIEMSDLELSKKTLSLTIGKGKKLYLLDWLDDVKVPGKDPALTWTSADHSVAKVDNSGYVTAVGPGTTYVKVKAFNYSWKCKITVKAPVLSITKKTLCFNDSFHLTLKNYNGKMACFSSNKKIAAVNSKGIVTSKNKSGKVTITVKALGKKYKCVITVIAPVLSDTKKTLGYKNTFQLTLKNYSGKMTCNSSNNKIATVNSKGLVTTKSKNGKATITVKAGGKKYKCVVTVKDTRWDNVEKIYKQKVLDKDTVWYVDRRDTDNEKGKTVIHPFLLKNGGTMIFSFFPENKTTFAIFNTKNKIIWTKTISTEKHFMVNLNKGKYMLKALTTNDEEYYNGYSLRVVRNDASFMPIELGQFYINSAGGVEPSFLILNNTGKTIKYINFRVTFYNAVWDRVNNDIGGYAYEDLQIVGPLKPWYCDWISFDPVFYNNTVRSFHVDSYVITFMDGSTKTIWVNKNYFHE